MKELSKTDNDRMTGKRKTWLTIKRPFYDKRRIKRTYCTYSLHSQLTSNPFWQTTNNIATLLINHVYNQSAINWFDITHFDFEDDFIHPGDHISPTYEMVFYQGRVWLFHYLLTDSRSKSLASSSKSTNTHESQSMRITALWFLDYSYLPQIEGVLVLSLQNEVLLHVLSQGMHDPSRHW